MHWILYIALFCIMVACDLLWIGVMWGYIEQNIIDIQNGSPCKIHKATIPIIYALMYLGIVLICLPLTAVYGLGAGALVGFVIYGIYDMCLLLEFKSCSGVVAGLDIAWGTLLFFSLTAIAVEFENVQIPF